MGNNLNVRILDCGEEAVGHGLAVELHEGMDGSDHDIELRQDFVAEVQGTVLQNIDFDAGKQTDSGDAFLSGADFLDLSESALFVHTICDGDSFGMVGESDVFIP